MDSLGLAVESVFVPWSQSRNKDEKVLDHNGKPTKQPRYSLNWKVTLKRAGREIVTTDYSAGCGHTAAYKASVKALGLPNCIMRDNAIRHECESGAPWSSGFQKKQHKANPLDVLYSLVMDSDVIDYPTYEEWADALGYDADSRKGEATYRACLEIALKLRAGIGEDGLRQLREAFQDY